MNTPDIYTITPTEVQEAEEEVRRCERAWREAGAFAPASESQIEQVLQHARRFQTELEEAKARSRPSLELKYYRLVHLFGRTGVARLGKAAFIGYASAVTCGLSFLLAPFLFPTLGIAICGSLIMAFFGFCLATAAAIGFWPDDLKFSAFYEQQREWVARKKRVEILQPVVGRSWAAYKSLLHQRVLFDHLEKAWARQRQLADLVGSAKYRLIHTDWRALRGIPFEDFLTDVFHILGYNVETTKKSGDQGVDLIAAGKGRRIAVQAKGYEGSVGNHAVMEVHTGMKLYQCDMCVVITNSSFTRFAQECAAGVGCLLVDGGRIPDLIEGRVL